MARLSSIFSAVLLTVALVALQLGAAAGAFAQRPPRENPPSQDAEARRVFDIAAAAFAGGRYAEALDHFEAAYRLSPRPQLLYNIGLAQDRLRQDRAAIASFERFLAEVPDTTKRVEVEGRLSALRDSTRRQEEREARSAIERDQLALDARDADLRARSAGSGSVFTSPWFWLIVGVIVVGAGTATAVAVSTSDPGVQPPIPGTDGVVIMALDSR